MATSPRVRGFLIGSLLAAALSSLLLAGAVGRHSLARWWCRQSLRSDPDVALDWGARGLDEARAEAFVEHLRTERGASWLLGWYSSRVLDGARDLDGGAGGTYYHCSDGSVRRFWSGHGFGEPLQVVPLAPEEAFAARALLLLAHRRGLVRFGDADTRLRLFDEQEARVISCFEDIHLALRNVRVVLCCEGGAEDGERRPCRPLVLRSPPRRGKVSSATERPAPALPSGAGHGFEPAAETEPPDAPPDPRRESAGSARRLEGVGQLPQGA